MIQGLSGVTTARGLPADVAEKAAKLVETLNAASGDIGTKQSYYDGSVSVKSLGLSLPRDFAQKLNVSCSWPATCVNVLANRSRFQGFSFATGYENAAFDALMRDDDFALMYTKAVTSELVCGCGFWTLAMGADGRPHARFHNAHTATALWDGARNGVSCGLAIIDGRTSNHDNTWRPSLVNIYTDNATWICSRDGDTERWSATEVPTPMGRPLIEPMVYRPDDDSPFGHSRVSRSVRDLSQSYMREMQRLDIGAELFTSPQKALLGADSSQLGMDKLTAYVTNVLCVGKDDDGDIPSLIQLAAASMQPHLDVIRELGRQFCGSTGCAMSDIGLVQDNSYQTSKEPIIIEADSLNATNGRALRNVALMALAMLEGVSLAELTDEQRAVRPVFASTVNANPAALADYAVKVVQVAPYYAETRDFWRELGKTEDEIDAIEASKRQAESAAVIRAAITGGGNGND